MNVPAHKRRPAYFCLLLVAAILLAGCASLNTATELPATDTPGDPPLPADTPTLAATITPFQQRPTSTPLPSPTPTNAEALPGYGFGPTNFPGDIDPLTGLRVTDLHLLDRRPIVVKVTNFPREVRPQWGLSLADHIYEYYIGDQMTRFGAVFLGQDASRVGPVRSARMFDTEMIRMYKSVLVFAYGDAPIIQKLNDSGLSSFLIFERPDSCPPLCRIGPENDYNTLYVDTSQMGPYVTGRGITNERQNLNGYRFEARSLITVGGGAGERISVHYSNISYHLWEYDSTTQRYLRSQETSTQPPGSETYAPLMDSLTGQQIAADNLVILLVKTDLVFQSRSTKIYDASLIGDGDGYALREGRIFKIHWSRNSEDKLVQLTLNGISYPFKTGNTWFIVLGETSFYRKTAAADWEFTFSIP